MKKVVSIFCVVFFLVLMVSFSFSSPPQEDEPDITIQVHKEGGKIIKKGPDKGKVGYKTVVRKVVVDTNFYFYGAYCSGKGLNVCPPTPTREEIKAKYFTKDTVSKIQQENSIFSE